MKQLLVLLAVFFPSLILAQANFQSGIVFKNNGDTLRGYINNREWSNSPKMVEFKFNKNDPESKRILPQEYKGFQFAGSITYTSFNGLVSTAVTNLSSLSYNLDTTKTRDTVFIKQLVTGKRATLYKYSTNKKIIYFIGDSFGNLTELKYYAYFTDDAEGKKVAYVNTYKEQLTAYVNKLSIGDKNLLNRINNVSYTAAGLQEITNTINGVQQVATKNKFVSFFIGASANITSTDMSLQYSYLDKNITSTGISPKISLGFDLFKPGSYHLLTFRGEISFSYIKPHYNSAVPTNYPDRQQSSASYSFNQYSFSVTPQVIFNFYHTPALTMYVAAGLGINFSTYNNNVLIVDNTDTGGSDPEHLVIHNPYLYKKSWINVPAQLGVMVHQKIEIFAAYAAYSKFADADKNTNPPYYDAPFKARNQSVNAGFKYHF